MKALFSSLLCAALCGCASVAPSVPQIKTPGYLGVLRSEKVDPVTYARMANGRVLGFGDIQNLVSKGVPGNMIVPYLKATRTPYKFSTAQINTLVKDGADDVLINYLGKAAGIYMEDEGDVPAHAGGARLHPYWTDPGYMGPAPFDFGYPDVWYGDFVNRAPQNSGGGHGGR